MRLYYSKFQTYLSSLTPPAQHMPDALRGKVYDVLDEGDKG